MLVVWLMMFQLIQCNCRVLLKWRGLLVLFSSHFPILVPFCVEYDLSDRMVMYLQVELVGRTSPTWNNSLKGKGQKIPDNKDCFTEGMTSRGILTALRSGPMRTLWSSTRSSARSCTWVRVISNINTDWGSMDWEKPKKPKIGCELAMCACSPESQLYPAWSCAPACTWMLVPGCPLLSVICCELIYRAELPDYTTNWKSPRCF